MQQLQLFAIERGLYQKGVQREGSHALYVKKRTVKSVNRWGIHVLDCHVLCTCMHLWTLFRWERNLIRYWAFIYLFVTPDNGKKPSVLFKSVSFFLSKMAMLGITAASNCFTAGSSSVKSEVFTPKEIDSYNRYTSVSYKTLFDIYLIKVYFRSCTSTV